ncbi:MAG TPA: carboxypeptidase regulatory-like domain-containing protein [Kofleriaceae bacterium]|nr:carboxypeptidase regulatory-like domain-containing protein [Kofleriaceae bacterium]
MKDKAGVPLPGVTVVATSPALQGSQAEITDSNGRYMITNLPPGTYLLWFYYSSAKVQVKDVEVRLGQAKVVNQSIDPMEGEVIILEDRGTIIDPTSTSQGLLITQDQMQNIPVPGRTFASTLGAAAGSQGDSRGVAFSGSTSLENQYVIDGVNTTALNFGTVGTPLINEFIEEIQILTGGYQAEFGRATGGVVNVVTKSGSNDFHGSVFSTIVPYQVNRTPVRPLLTSIAGVTDLDYQLDFGFDLGGPIVKDKVWFYVGFAPQLARNNIARIVQRQTDCREVMPDGQLSTCDPEAFGDGAPDEDPETGDRILEEVDRTEFKAVSSAYQFVSKINFAVRPEHQGQVSLLGAPVAGEGLFGVSGSPRATRADFQGLNTDIAAKWTSKFNNNKTEVEVIAGWHRDKYDQDAIDPAADDSPTSRIYFSNLSRFGEAGNEQMATMQGCNDSAARGADAYPFIENCPVFQYWLDSPGFIINNLEDRRSIALKATQRANFAGTHIIKGGLDTENNRTVDVRHLTGGRFYQVILGGYDQVRTYRYVRPGESGADVCGFNQDDDGRTNYDDPRTCDYLDESEVVGNTFNWAGFLQDSWQVQPNITINLGMRYEEQRLRYAEHLRGTTDDFTNQELGKNAITLRNMWAPRLGAIYDWTKEGRSKVYVSAGRFYESIPMALNDFSFSGDTLYGAFFGFAQCQNGPNPSQDSSGSTPSPYNCPDEITQSTNPTDGEVYRGGTTVVTPGTKAQFMDEAILGVQYEIIEDFTLGASLKTRRIGRVLEDMSIDNADTYIIGNPGEFDPDEEARLQAELDGLDPLSDEYDVLAARLEGFRHLRRFDKPRRDYNALELTATKRFSKRFYLQGSYTYSRAQGNYPGLLNDDTGQALPNISTQYDLAELLANRDGPLPQDRPHYIKLDGYYTHDFGKGGIATAGLRFRALSGTPLDALGGHYLYGFGESYLLPRGSQGRTEFVTGTDIHVSYGRRLAGGYDLTVFTDVINLFNQEQVSVVDELWTFDYVNPVVGGDPEDLIFAKEVSNTGAETTNPIGRNVAYGTPLGRYTPLYIRFGARLKF